MAKLLCERFNIHSVPESYVLPKENQPGNVSVPACKTIPVIDLNGENGKERTDIVQETIKASQEFGFFQVINHGIPQSVIKDMMGVAEEFFEMPAENRASLYSDDPKQLIRVSTSLQYDKEGIHYWRDVLRHPCHPLDKFKHLWPSKPTNYREIAEIYALEMKRLGSKLLELICEGLGIQSDYFEDEIYTEQLMGVNYYPTCPDPSLTLGLPKHCDPNIITLLLQGDVAGLQVLKNGEWIAIEPIRNAFVINLGHQLEVISNGMLYSAEHRVVTNSSVARTTIGTFFHPSIDSMVQPALNLVNESNPPKFKPFKYQEFHATYVTLKADREKVMEHFKL